MSVSSWKDKQIVVDPSNGVLLTNKKELVTDRGNSMEERQKHYVKWKKVEGGWGRRKGLTAKEHEETFGINGNVLCLICDGVYNRTCLSKFIQLHN